MLRYGALYREDVTSPRIEQNRSSRAWPISTVMLSLMTATVLFLFWDGKGGIISDVQPVVSTRSELQERKSTRHSTHGHAKKVSKAYSLASPDVPIYGDYVDDMQIWPPYFPSSQTLVKGSQRVGCGDTVAWGR
jgi:hypothetical protein